MKLFLEVSKIEFYVDLHKKMSLPFWLTVTNYTTRIKSDYCDIHFLRTTQSKKMFAAYAMLKKDVSTKPVPIIDRLSVEYFNNGFKQNIFLKTVYNFDIKSAYVSCLQVNGLISNKTATYLNTMPKLDRLAAVGMLAGRKSTFLIDKHGKAVEETTTVSPYENFFFFCVDEISKMMNEVALYLGNAFLFTWVDGIYSYPHEIESAKSFYKIISPVFNERGYKTSFEILNDFRAESQRNAWFVSFIKDGKKKIFNIPKKELDLKRQVEKYLLNKNYNNLKQK